MADSGGVTAQILDGKAAAAEIRTSLLERVASLRMSGASSRARDDIRGDDPGIRWRTCREKHRDCAEVGITSIRYDLPADAPHEQAVRDGHDEQANARRSRAARGTSCSCRCHASSTRGGAGLERMDPAKDADGLHPSSLSQLVLGEARFRCPARHVAVSSSCAATAWSFDGGRGRGDRAWRDRRTPPRAPPDQAGTENATVTLCHTGTRDLAAAIRAAPTSLSSPRAGHAS